MWLNELAAAILDRTVLQNVLDAIGQLRIANAGGILFHFRGNAPRCHWQQCRPAN